MFIVARSVTRFSLPSLLFSEYAELSSQRASCLPSNTRYPYTSFMRLSYVALSKRTMNE